MTRRPEPGLTLIELATLLAVLVTVALMLAPSIGPAWTN